MNVPPVYLALLMTFLAATCDCNAVEENEVVIQLQADVEELRRLVDSLRNLVEEAVAGSDHYESKVTLIAGPPGRPGLPGIAGRDGRDGAKGESGANGRDGTDGLTGRDGLPGRDGEQGAAGPPGVSGRDGIVGPVGEPGPKGDTGSVRGGVVYTRWGRTTCGSDATLLYEGFTGGSRYDHTGGGVDYQCMANDAEYATDSSENIQYYGSLAGTEYQSVNFGIFSDSTHDQNAPCAVCYVANRSAIVVVPGKRSCPDDEWNMEYQGYLMSEYQSHKHQSTFECVDAEPEHIDGESANNDGALFYFTKPVCDKGVPCPPYQPTKAITCVVCTK